MAHVGRDMLPWLQEDAFFTILAEDDTLRDCFWNIIHQGLPQTSMLPLLRMGVDAAINLNDWQRIDAMHDIIVNKETYMSNQISRILDLAINNPGRYDWALQRFPNRVVPCGRRVLVAALEKPADPSVFVVLAQADARHWLWGEGGTVLMACAAYGLVEAVERLLECGFGPNAAGPSRSDSTPLLSTMLFDMFAPSVPARIVQLLVAAGAHVNEPNRYRETPIQWAAAKGLDQCVEILLSAGANPNAQPDSGCTALHLAVAHARHRCVELLLAAGADPNLRNTVGTTPLELAANKPDIRLLFEKHLMGAARAKATL